MFFKPLIVINAFALGIVVGVLTQRDVAGLPNLRMMSFSSPVLRPEPKEMASQLTVRTTAYCHLENEPGAVGNLNCLGTELRYDNNRRSAAADWSKYPVGTQFRILGDPYLYEIDDYGSGLVGTDTIDLYKPTLELMNEWGVRNVVIEIVKMGSFERSSEVMEPRLHYPHVAEMYQNIQPYLSN
ncbi:MAG: 3D domain-containing protein [Verrucomicrobiales bacterium]|nr:3D domain-containing protein [Verrucomicrobiales bacterium]